MSNNLKDQTTSLLSILFASADQRGRAAAVSFAECFTENAQLRAGSQAALNGRTDIEASREKSWDGVVSRTHTMSSLYTSVHAPQQFVVLGTLELLLDGAKAAVNMRFCAKLDVERNREGEVKIAKYEAFAEAPSPVK